MKIFYLPDLGEGLPDAEIREWYIKEGDEIKIDQPLVAMETAKAVVDVPSPRTGRIKKLHGNAGDVIATGAPLVEFADGEEETPKKSSTVVGSLESSDTVLVESATGIKPVTSGGAIKAMPAVRALAKRLNVVLASLQGTGSGGQITLDDVEKAAAQPAAVAPSTTKAAAPEGFEALRGVRKAMASTMAQSHSEVVPITVVDDADIHNWPEKTDITLRVIHAIIAACKEEPSLNAWYHTASNSRKLHNSIHLGLAMDSEEGLFVPVLKDITQQSTEELRTTINRFKEQVRNRTIPQDDLKGATFVLSNVGVFAGRYANPIIVPPTVAILAVGRIHKEVVAFQDEPAVHRIIPLSLSVDHRVITGGEATRFLAALIKDLEAS